MVNEQDRSRNRKGVVTGGSLALGETHLFLSLGSRFLGKWGWRRRKRKESGHFSSKSPRTLNKYRIEFLSEEFLK